MKAIKKSTLLALASYTREYVRTGKVDPPSARIDTARDLATQAYGRENVWLSFADFVDSVIGACPLHPECTDDELCELFRVLKFEVLDE